MSIKKITMVYDPDVADWEALYVDEKLVLEGHSLVVQDVLDVLHGIGAIEYAQQNGTPALTGYRFPSKLEEVQYDPDYTEED